jgi:Ca-activated chloride channel family protein
LEASGSTAALDALYAGLILPPTHGSTLIVLFSDGRDNQSWLDHRQLRAAAERSLAQVHVVGLRAAAPSLGVRALPTLPPEPAHIGALREIAEITGGRYWEAETPERLTHAFAAIAEAMGQRYVLRYEPQGPKQPGWHRIELRLRAHKGDVHARRGYWMATR